MPSTSSAPDVLPAKIRKRLSELLDKVSNNTFAIRMWEDVMTSEDRERLRDKVNSEPVIPRIDHDTYPAPPSGVDEMQDGWPGEILHRCYRRWRADGMWMIAKGIGQPQAIAELAREHGFLGEREYLRLLEAIGGSKVQRQRSKLPEWDRDERTLRFEGTVIRKIRSLTIARNVVAILDAFQNRHWCSRVTTPATLREQGLHDAVYTLNHNLKKLRFHVDSDGCRVRWTRHR
ncbi:MAG: hypothetical protein GXX96_35435 [Planctomycetaceae bacterium]|nr:hypothetical protein [Planctomycetaceae bacterium]